MKKELTNTETNAYRFKLWTKDLRKALFRALLDLVSNAIAIAIIVFLLKKFTNL